MASANDGANLLAEYFGGGTIADGVAAMNAQVEELGLAHTHFSNPHGISDDDHYTSCYDMAQILRWALQQPGFEDLFTRNEMYTMQPTNIQPVTRYFSQQDKIASAPAATISTVCWAPSWAIPTPPGTAMSVWRSRTGCGRSARPCKAS